jgi:Arc/MetJ-type ribon-helix-helix transcriptional regulator
VCVGRQAVRDDLEDERLEQVEVAPVDEGHVDGGSRRWAHRLQAGEPTAADDDATPVGASRWLRMAD